VAKKEEKMKRIALTIALIAILVGAAFIAMAASDKGNGVPADLSTIDAKVTALQDSVSALTEGKITRMETRTGHVIDNQPISPLYVYNEGWPQMRHASITLKTSGMGNGTVLQIWIDVGGWACYAAEITTDGLYVLDYDTKSVRLLAYTPGPPFTVDYNMTLTYAN
jgi:hypothetical protein